MSKGNCVLCFLLGLGIGAASAWIFAKERYERIAQEEIDSVKEVFSKKDITEPKEETEEKIEQPVRDRQKPDLMEYAAKLRSLGYSDDSSNDGSEDGPYVISPEDFGEVEEYDSISLVYYADGVVADENDDILEDLEATIGRESLNHFGEYEDDSVFVRNDTLRCDYEILLDNRTYEEVTGNRVGT